MNYKRLLGYAVIVAISLMIQSPARGAKSYTFDSRSYSVTSTLDDRQAAADIARYMDAVFIEYSNRMAGFRQRGGQGNVRMPLYIMQNQEDYLTLLGRMGVDASNTAGVFFRGPRGSGLATFVEGQSESRMYHVLQHEGFHQFADSRISDRLPQWLNEGMAEYFGEGVVIRGRLQVGLLDGLRLATVQQVISKKKYLPFSQFMNLTNAEWGQRVANGEDAEVMYDMAWSVVHFLVHGGKGRYRPALEQYLQLLNRGKDPRKAFDEVFGANINQFEQAWIRETSRMAPDAWLTSLRQLEVMAEALRLLHASGSDPATFDDLKNELSRRGFRLRQSNAHTEGETKIAAGAKRGGGERAAGQSAAPPAAPASTTKPAATRSPLDFPMPGVATVRPSDDPKLPAGMSVKKISPELKLTWRLDRDGKPQSVIDSGR